MEPIGQGTWKEHVVPVIEAEDHNRPMMIGTTKGKEDILREMQPLFECSSGIKLQPSTAYGIRAYRNDTS